MPRPKGATNKKGTKASPKIDSVDSPIDKIEKPSIELTSNEGKLNVSDFTPNPKPAAQKIISPMLAEGVEIKDHALGIGPDSNGQSNPSMQVEGDFFNTKPYDPNPPKPVAPGASQTPQQVAQGILGNTTPVTPLKNDAPEQRFNMDPGAGNIDSQTNPVIDEAARQATSDLVDTVTEMYERAVPELTHDYTKISVKDIRIVKGLEEKGEALVGLTDDLKTINKDNKERLKERCRTDAQMLKKPLKRWLTTKNIPVPPWVEVLMVVFFIGLTYFILIKEIKSSNQAMMEQILAKVKKNNAPEMTVSQGGVQQAVAKPNSDLPDVSDATIIP